MKSITKQLSDEVRETGVRGIMVCRATAGETPMGAIYKLRDGSFEAVPFDHPCIRRFDDPHKAQWHIEKCKPY